mmetsp:Transcript_3639/g.5429  ORF Transcript_3639/g.5429 Transcript_3639/m.5429 type:complete len:176 (-) Transcript_3639:999-1526(-)
MIDVSAYKVGLIVQIKDCGSFKTKGKILRECLIRINPDDEADLTSVVTSAANVREGSRVVVAPEGSIVWNEEGEEVTVKKANVGGSVSEGMLCDSAMLGWSGGAKGVAVQVPESFSIGSSPPASKPRMDQTNDDVVPAVEVQGLFEKKLTKEEKKKVAEERRRRKKEGIAPNEGQ